MSPTEFGRSEEQSRPAGRGSPFRVSAEDSSGREIRGSPGPETVQRGVVGSKKKGGLEVGEVLTVFGLRRQRPPELVDELRVEHVQGRRGRHLGRRRRRRRGLGGTLQAGLRVPRRVPGRHAAVVVLLAAVVERGRLGHGAQRPVRRRPGQVVLAARRRGQRRAVRRPGTAVHPSGGGARRGRRAGRLVVGTLGHAPVPVRLVDVVVVFHDGHHKGHGGSGGEKKKGGCSKKPERWSARPGPDRVRNKKNLKTTGF